MLFRRNSVQTEKSEDDIVHIFSSISYKHKAIKAENGEYTFKMKGVVGLIRCVPRFRVKCKLQLSESNQRLFYEFSPSACFWTFSAAWMILFIFALVTSLCNRTLPNVVFCVLLLLPEAINIVENSWQRKRLEDRLVTMVK